MSVASLRVVHRKVSVLVILYLLKALVLPTHLEQPFAVDQEIALVWVSTGGMGSFYSSTYKKVPFFYSSKYKKVLDFCSSKYKISHLPTSTAP